MKSATTRNVRQNIGRLLAAFLGFALFLQVASLPLIFATTLPQVQKTAVASDLDQLSDLEDLCQQDFSFSLTPMFGVFKYPLSDSHLLATMIADCNPLLHQCLPAFIRHQAFLI
jgi:hypothetical protein